jgi:hypothetical protein
VWVALVVGGAVVVGVSVWVALSGYELWLRGSLAGAVAWLVWVSLMAGVVQFQMEFRVVAVGRLLWISWLGSDVLVELGLRMGVVEWLLWVSLVVMGMLFNIVFCLVIAGWHV